MMDHEQLLIKLEKRLDKIEHKLDVHLELVSQHRTEISWIKGYIKLSLSALLAISTGVISTIFKVFFTTN